MMARPPSSRIYPLAKVVNDHNLSMGEYATIDDFAFVNAGRRLVLGRYVHVACHASVIGGGECEFGDYSVLATGARILTATDTFRRGARMSTHLPAGHRAVFDAPVVIARDAFIGANAVVMPGVTIGEGAVVGAGAVVTSDLQDWTVYAGVPARRIGERPRPTTPGP